MAEGIREGLAQGRAQGMQTGRDEPLAEQRERLDGAGGIALGGGAAIWRRGGRSWKRRRLRKWSSWRSPSPGGSPSGRACSTGGARREILREAMKLVVQHADVRIAIHPASGRRLQDVLPRLAMEWPALKHVEIIEDATIAPRRLPDLHRPRTGRCRSGSRSLIGSSPTLLPVSPDARGGVSELPRLSARRGRSSMPFGVIGQVQAITGMTLEAADLTLPLGSLCRITSFGGKNVVGGSDRVSPGPHAADAADQHRRRVSRRPRSKTSAAVPRIWCSEQLLGRVL